MGVLFLPTKTLICCNKRKHNVSFELHSEKKNCENQKKDWQTVGYEQDYIDDKTCRKRAEEYKERSGLATKIRFFCRTWQDFFKKDAS